MTKRKRIILLAAGAFAGAVAGYLYWKFIGCNSGTCLISSKPLNSTLYFSVMGALLMNVLIPSANKDSNTL
jgi:hypothetical protein